MAAKRILLIKLSSIGDIVMATPAAKAVRTAFSDAYITWAVDSRFSELLSGNPYVDEVITWHRGKGLGRGMAEFTRLARAVRSRRFDTVVDLQGNGRSALLTLCSGATRRIGYAQTREFAQLAYSERVACAEFPHGMSCHAGLLHALSPDARFERGEMFVPISDEDRRFAEDILLSEVGDSIPVAALFPATTRLNKHWPAERWAALAQILCERLGITPLLLGSPGDAALGRTISSSVSGGMVSVVGRTTLPQAAALIERSALAIGVDTGLLHMAVALNRPTVGIYGPTDAWRNHEHATGFRAVYESMECAPCRRRPTCRDFDCMNAISPEKVFDAVQEVFCEEKVTA